MIRRKTLHSQEEQGVHSDIDYHGVTAQVLEDDDDIATDDVIAEIRDGATKSMSSWKVVVLEKLYSHRGLLWAIFSVCVSTSLALCIKLLAGHIATSQVVFFRGCAQVLFSVPHLVFHRVSLRFPLKISLLILSRTLVGTVSAFLLYFAFQVIPVATAKALVYTSPLFTGVFARMCLGERCSVGKVFFAFLSVLAVTLVIQPPFVFGGGDAGNVPGILCAIVGAAFMAGNAIILRLTQILDINAHAIIVIYGFVSIAIAATAMSALGEWTNPMCGMDRRLVVGLGLTGYLEQISVTLALKTEPALLVTIIRTNDVFLSFIFDFLIFDIVPNAWTIVGAILVVGSAIGMTVSSNREKERQQKEKKMEEEVVVVEKDEDVEGNGEEEELHGTEEGLESSC